MHKLLKRQLKRLKRQFPDGDISLDALLEVVNATYNEADRERNLKDRSLKLMSEELLDLNQRIRQESQDYISMILNQVVDGVCTFDKNLIIKGFNPAMEQLFGIPESEMIGRSIASLTYNEAQDQPEDLILLYQEHFAGSQQSDTLESVGIRAHGERFPIELSLSHMQGEEEETYIAIIRDISSRKESEQILIAARDKAEEISQAKSNFLSVMSHEIRTPMNAVLGITNLLLEEGPREDQLESLQSLKFSGEHLLVLINDVLDFSKIEAGKLVFESIDLSLANVTSHIIAALNVKAEEKGIAIKKELDPRLPAYVKGDPSRLAQILNNLIGNAIKFTNEGHVKIKIDYIGETEKNLSIRFAVEDTGIGIAADKLDSIFESFTQSNSTITRKYGGTGLGLAITKRLINLQKSEIEVQSELGKGTTFSFLLEMPKSDLVAEKNQKKTQKVGKVGFTIFEKQKILLVEDNRVNQMVASRFLKKWSLNPIVANDGQEALQKVQEHQFSLVLMDLQMPVMDGLTSSREIRNLGDAKFQQLPIIALTASVNGTVKNDIYQAGMDDIISKPFQPEMLNKVIGHYLEHGRSLNLPLLNR
ncbi:MAG: ATP-binding protein [Bacteroidota bacterium]